jgi:hypothetical protein
LAAANVSEITSVTDSEGNEYFEVDYMAQDIVFKELPNNNFLNDNVASVIKPYLVTRKYVVERDRFNTYLQFGSGNSAESNVVADPQSVAINIYGKDYITDISFDPTRLSKNESFGIVPANTTLTIAYRVTGQSNSNVGANTLNSVSNAKMDFTNPQNLVNSTIQTVVGSLEVSNEEPIIGNTSTPSSTEIKRRIFDTFPTQNRAVTQADYENLVYRMPGQFGSIKRCSAQKDPNSLKRNLNLYVISEDSQGKLIETNSAIKDNIKTWLNQYRMINDTIDISNPYILNLGIEFSIKAATGTNKFTLLDKAVNSLANKFGSPLYIGEPLYISDIYSELKNVKGILDVLTVKLVNKNSSGYSSANININENLSPDGSYLVVPANALVEIKYPATDIRGKVV